ncbi:MAG: (2Fe-2S)-binding protein [Pirellulales bacterium]|nr:(2Fe-2S)-binding protein [Pirellulales bacterium]
MKDQPHLTLPRGGVSRRAFLKGSGATAAAAAAISGTTAVEAAESRATFVAAETVSIELRVNGAMHKVTVEPRTTLLDVLRYRLDLTGAKPVSIDASSGASTVLIDGKPASANVVLALDCRGKHIQTAESLGGKDPDPVVKAFIKHDAMQCGFCTPGFVVAVRAFLDQHPNATKEQILNGLNGNLCRCGTYANVIMAALDAAKGGK